MIHRRFDTNRRQNQDLSTFEHKGVSSVNDKIYIHEFIDIIGHNRANYMHHMTANFSPTAQEERHQLCYGVWGSGRLDQEAGRKLSTSGRRTASTAWPPHSDTNSATPTLQDPKLAKWWAEAAKFRSGGLDRLLVPAPWTRTIEELCADGVRGETYAHEQITVPPGRSSGIPRARPRSRRCPGLRKVRLAAGRRVGDGHGGRLRVLLALGHPLLGALGRVREGTTPGRRHRGVAPGGP